MGRSVTIDIGSVHLDIEYGDPNLQPQIEELVAGIRADPDAARSLMRDGATIGLGYCDTRVRRLKRDRFELWELAIEGHLVRGVERSLRIMRDQQQVCAAIGAAYDPPPRTDLAAFDGGVLEGARTEGVRYLPSDRTSGWIITSERYSGRVADLLVEHLFHLSDARPDITPYLGLPPGYRFDLYGSTGRAWRDDDALR